jgi:phosphoenolpyruvate carboxykinase (diphosphate)
MDFICSLTGKSPSTTGAGSEGALTKGPFNMLVPTTDLNNALLSYILTEYQVLALLPVILDTKTFDHDISILIPEIWARLSLPTAILSCL